MNLDIQFMQHRYMAMILSGVLLLLSVVSLGWQGLQLGLEFTGGTQIELSWARSIDTQDVRRQLREGGITDVSVVYFGSQNDVLVRTAADDKGLADRMVAILRQADASVQVKRVEFVGPQIGEELRDQGGLGLLLALGVVLLYVAFRFQFKFSVGSVAALIHDVLITLGVFSILRWEFDLTVLAALLAVIGYSLNDTIVVADRIRENFRLRRHAHAVAVINTSLNQTLGRTVVTSTTTLLVLCALLFFGGELMRGFSLALIIGVLVGTYSSIYVAATVLLLMDIRSEDLVIPEPEGRHPGA